VTPEEKAVIEASFDAYNHLGKDGTSGRFEEAMRALIDSCPQCDAGGHTCPGDGEPIGHTATDCGHHGPEVDPGWGDPWAADFRPADPADALKVTAGTYPCIDCITDPDEDPAPWCRCSGDETCGPDACRNRAHQMERCANRPCACSRTERVYCQANDCHGGLDVRECSMCKRQLDVPGDPDSIDCGGDCAACMRQIEAEAVAEPLPPPPPSWVASTLLYCLAGDRIRIGTDETDVLRSSSGAWHANVVSSVMPSGKTWDKISPWEHTELRMELSANPGFQQYPPNLACEIWMTAERLAVHTLMTRFPGSTVTGVTS
jgi:hypothetical protein